MFIPAEEFMTAGKPGYTSNEGNPKAIGLMGKLKGSGADLLRKSRLSGIEIWSVHVKDDFMRCLSL